MVNDNTTLFEDMVSVTLLVLVIDTHATFLLWIYGVHNIWANDVNNNSTYLDKCYS